MSWQHTAGLMLVTGTGVLAVILAVITWLRRPLPGASALALVMLGLAVWLLNYALELQSTSVYWASVWSKIEYIGIAGVPAGWLVFALQFTERRRWLTRWVLGLLTLGPCVTIALVWTNEWHGLIWRSVTLNQQGPFSSLDVVHGYWFWFHTIACYVCMLLSGIILISSHLRLPHLYRGQIIGLLISVLVPWIGSILYLSGVRPLGQLDLTPLTLTFSCTILLWALLRFRLLKIVPIARDAVIDNLRDGVIVLDARAHVVDVNPAAQQIIERTASEIVGQPVQMALPDWPETHDLSHDVHTAQREVTIATHATQRFFDLHISLVHDKRERMCGWLLVWHDISERKRTEAVLSAAKEVAESANRAKSAFLAHMSHEFRTPLTAILGYSQLLELELRQAQQIHLLTDLHTIQNAGHHLLDLINNVLDFSKIEAGKMNVQLSRFDVAELVHNVEIATRLLIEQHNNTLDMVCAAQIGTMYSDRTKVYQLLLNLLSNAAKFTENGTVTLNARLEGPAPSTTALDAFPSTPPTILFEVRDTGIGIAPANLPHLFQPFIQTRDESQPIYPGTGLGLAISRHLCHLLGGEISVTSTPGQGSIFCVRLPLVVTAPVIDAHTLAAVHGMSVDATNDAFPF